MKQLIRNFGFQAFVFLLMVNVLPLLVMAQDSSGGGSTTTTTTTRRVTETSWYTSPWVWVAGAAVFILLLIALMRGGSKSGSSATDRVTVTKTTNVERE